MTSSSYPWINFQVHFENEMRRLKLAATEAVLRVDDALRRHQYELQTLVPIGHAASCRVIKLEVRARDRLFVVTPYGPFKASQLEIRRRPRPSGLVVRVPVPPMRVADAEAEPAGAEGAPSTNPAPTKPSAASERRRRVREVKALLKGKDNLRGLEARWKPDNKNKTMDCYTEYEKMIPGLTYNEFVEGLRAERKRRRDAQKKKKQKQPAQKS